MSDDPNFDQAIIPALGRAHQILAKIAHSEEGVTAGEFLHDLDIPKSTLHRLLNSLRALGYVVQNERPPRYVLGPSVGLILRSRTTEEVLVDIAQPVADRLANKLTETVKISVFRRDFVEVIYRKEVESDVYVSVKFGSRLPLHTGASSKVLLAFQSTETREQVFREPLQRYTERTIVNPERLREELEDVRRTGVGFDDSEHVDGIRAIAVPIMDWQLRCVAAISLVYVVQMDYADDHRATQVAALKRAAEEISLKLGAPSESLPWRRMNPTTEHGA